MQITLTITEPVADRIRALAATRGMSMDDISSQALLAGLLALTDTADQPIIDLGAINPYPPTAEQVLRMPWPIFATAPVTPKELKPFEELFPLKRPCK
jgi:hypothetical protein